MSENPYQSPEAETQVVGVRSGSHEDLRSVAVYQKGILVCILIYIVAVVFRVALPPELQFLLAAAILVDGIIGTIFVVLLAMKVYRTGIGILLGILALVPCFGLLVLLAVNSKATQVLKQNGIRVGLLGADLSQL